MQDFYKTLGTNISLARGEMHQKELADALGVSRETVTKWENGERKIKAEELLLLSNVLSVSADQLLGTNYSKDRELGIQNETGLSHMAIKNLSVIKNFPYFKYIDEFLQTINMNNILYLIDKSKRESVKAVDYILQSKEYDSVRFGVKKHEVRHLVRDISEEVEEKYLNEACGLNDIDAAIETMKERNKDAE